MGEKTSVSDPKRLFPDPDPTLKGIPDPTEQLFPDPIPDSDQHLTKNGILKKSFRSGEHWDCSTVFANFLSI